MNVTGFAASILDTDAPADRSTVCDATDLATVSNIDDGDVERLRSLASYAAAKMNVSFSGEETAVIHVARWSDKQLLTNQVWFVVTAQGKWLKENTVDTRIFSKHRVLLVYVHQGLTSSDGVQYKITAKKKTPENLEHVIELAKAFLGGTLGFQAPTNAICSWNAQAIKLNYVPSTLTFQAFAKPTPRSTSTPAPVVSANLVGTSFSSIRIRRVDATIQQVKVCRSGVCTDPIALDSNGEVTVPTTLCDSALCSVLGLTSDGKEKGRVTLGGEQQSAANSQAGNVVAATTGTEGVAKLDAPEIANRQYTNETLPWWDVTLMLQVKKVSDIQFSSDNNTVTAAKVDKQNLFVLADFFPLRHWERNWRIKGEFISFPISFGIPLTKKFLDRPFLGGGIGTRKFQFMAGAAFEAQQSPSTLSVGSTSSPTKLSSDLSTNRSPKLLLGLNLSVNEIVKALSKK